MRLNDYCLDKMLDSNAIQLNRTKYFLIRKRFIYIEICTDVIQVLMPEKTVIVYYVPRRIMRVITRRATMLAGDRSRGSISPASILSESRNYPNCLHWHIFYFM